MSIAPDSHDPFRAARLLPVAPIGVGLAAVAAAYPAYVGASRAAAHLLTAPARRRIAPRPDARRVSFAARDGVELAAWLFEPPRAFAAAGEGGAPRGTVVLAHGYRDDRRQLAPLAAALVARGLRALALDFRAHGESAGTRISIGADEAHDVRAALEYAAGLGGAGRVSYVGFSMGAAAYLLAGREAHAAVLDSPYDTLREAIYNRLDALRLPRALGGELVRYGEQHLALAVDTVRPIDAVPALARPTLFVFGGRDPWVPPAVRERFRAALSPACAFELIADRSHQPHDEPDWVARVTAFLESHYPSE